MATDGFDKSICIGTADSDANLFGVNNLAFALILKNQERLELRRILPGESDETVIHRFRCDRKANARAATRAARQPSHAALRLHDKYTLGNSNGTTGNFR
jgi:hypothetical protein